MSLYELSAKWMRNKEQLHFSAMVVFEKGSVSVIIDNAPRKYLKAIKDLAGKILVDALKAMSETYAFSVATADAEEEGKRIRNFLEARKTYLLNLLLEKGYDCFMAVITQDASILKMQYEIRSMAFKEGSGWVKWDGSVLTADGWLSSDGQVEEDALSVVLSKNKKAGITVA